MKLSSMARLLDSRGGKARDKNPTPEAKKSIAVLGGKGRAQNHLATQRVFQILRYMLAIRQLRDSHSI